MNYLLLSFEMVVPGETSKVPTCKNGVPDIVAYSITNSRNEEQTYYTSLITLDEDRYATADAIRLPIGEYTLNSIDLIREQEILYSVPTTDEPILFNYANVILPININMNADVQISAKAFCYTQSPIPIADYLLESDLETNRLGSLFFYVTNPDCLERVEITIDDVVENIIMVDKAGLYEVAIPEVINYMFVESYDYEDVKRMIHMFDWAGPYRPSGVLMFETDCD